MAIVQNIFLCFMSLAAYSTYGQKINFGQPGSGSKSSPRPPSPPPGFSSDGTANREDSPQEAAVAGFFKIIFLIMPLNL